MLAVKVDLYSLSSFLMFEAWAMAAKAMTANKEMATLETRDVMAARQFDKACVRWLWERWNFEAVWGDL